MIITVLLQYSYVMLCSKLIVFLPQFRVKIVNCGKADDSINWRIFQVISFHDSEQTDRWNVGQPLTDDSLLSSGSGSPERHLIARM